MSWHRQQSFSFLICALQNKQKIQKGRHFALPSNEGIVKYEPDSDGETDSVLDKNDFYEIQPGKMTLRDELTFMS